MSTIIPYIRGSVVDFTAKGLKPFTRVYPFFDNQDVSEYCKMNSDVKYNQPLVTNVNGELTGQFRIPSGTFLTGNNLFVLTNDSTGDTTNADANAVVSFVTNKSGIYDSSDIISTQQPNLTVGRFQTVQDPITARQTFGISYKDPIAQTFLVQNNPHGVALTKMDVYFKTRPESLSSSSTAADNAPITLQIREVVDGFPGDSILPYSSVTLHPKDVNPSDDASTPTVFLFPAPVYLKNNTEYAFVLIPAGDNNNYEVWVGRLGSQVVGGTTIVDRQPNIGTLFIANNNSSWVSYTDRDIKFTLYTAEFDYTVTGTAELKNKKVDYITVPSTETLMPGDILVRKTSVDATTAQGEVLYFNDTTSVAEVLVTSGDFEGVTSAGDTVVILSEPLAGTITCTTSSTTVTGSGTSFTSELAAGNLLVNSSGTTIGTISTITNNTSLVLTANAAVAVTAGRVYLKNTITITLNSNVVHVIAPGLSYLNFKTTVVAWDYKLFDTTGVDTTYQALPEISAVTRGERKLYSYSDEQSTLVPALNPSTEGTLMLQATVTATTDNISPMIDVEKTNVTLLENYVDALTDELAGTATTSTSSNIITGTLSTYIADVVVGSVIRNDDDEVLGVVNGVLSNTSLQLYDECTKTISVGETIKADNVASSEATIRVGQYITKTVELANNQDADDIIVYLNADIPPETDVRVYVKLLSAADTNGMAGRVWTLMRKERASSNVGFANWQYVLRKNANDESTAVGGLNTATPSIFQYKSLDGTSTYSTFKTFAVKIAMITSNPAVVPSVLNMGVIALQS